MSRERTWRRAGDSTPMKPLNCPVASDFSPPLAILTEGGGDPSISKIQAVACAVCGGRSAGPRQSPLRSGQPARYVLASQPSSDKGYGHGC